MNKTLKTVLTLAVIVLLVVGGYLGFRYVKGIIDSNITLGLQSEKLEALAAEKEAEREEAYHIVDSLSTVITNADKEIAVKDKEIAVLNDSLDSIPTIVEIMEPEARYDSLQTTYFDSTSNREYGFSQNQVKGIYTDVLSYQVLKGVNAKLVDSNTILKNQVADCKLIEVQLRVVIDGYEIENAELKDYINNANAKHIRVRTQRNVFGVIAAVAVAMAAAALAL